MTKKATEAPDPQGTTTDTAGKYGDLAAARKSVKKQMRLANKSFHDSTVLSRKEGERKNEQNQRIADGFSYDPRESIAVDLVEDLTRQGWTQNQIDAELARRGLTLPEDNS